MGIADIVAGRRVKPPRGVGPQLKAAGGHPTQKPFQHFPHAGDELIPSPHGSYDLAVHPQGTTVGRDRRKR